VGPNVGGDIPERHRWNRNIHYFPVLLDAVPDGAQLGLDVGCGEGMLTRQLAQRVDHVIGIDLDAHQVDLAEASTADDRITFLHDDVMTHPFHQRFDAVVSVAAVHHLPTRAGLARLADLVAPGGVLAIEGLARSTRPSDLLYNLVGAVHTRMLQHSGGRRPFDHSAPIVWPPATSFAETRRLTAELLPGARYRRRLLFRYTIIWHKPAPAATG
jgi:SAM-dependent methyltransferase